MNRAIILLAGQGTRLDSNVPKQFVEINGKYLFSYCLTTFEHCYAIDSILLVTNKEYVDTVKEYVKQHGFKKVQNVVSGGTTRQESVYNGLKALKANEDDVILIHDSARVLVSNEIIERNINACENQNAVVTAIKSCDSIASGNERIEQYLDRDEIYQIQTPQTFKYSLILKAHEKYINKQVTDDASLVKMTGHSVHFVTGSRLNFKVTTADDLNLITKYLS